MQTQRLDKLLGLSLLIYVLLIVGHGYVFGHLGTIETFPYIQKLQDPTLFPKDFYLNGIQSNFPDVRWIFVQLLLLLGITGPWSAFLMHFLVSILLILGMLRVALRYTTKISIAFSAVILTLLVLYNHNLGGNELYYNSLAPSFVAISISIWSLYFFLTERANTAILLLIPATLIHPMVGIQLFLIIVAIQSILTIQERQNQLSIFSILAYLVTAGTWVVILQRTFSDIGVDTSIIRAILKFRLAHHYFPSVYGLANYLLLVPIFLFGFWFYLKKDKTLFLFFGVTILGLLIYAVGVELTQIQPILSAQWFKTTIWLKFFSCIGLMAFIDEQLLKRNAFLRKYYTLFLTIALVGLGTLLLWKLPQRQPTTLDLPWRKPYNDRIKISLLAKEQTPKDALFLTPTDFTHLKYFGERSTYVDYKATIHFRSKLLEWYERILLVYQNNKKNSSLDRLSNNILQMPISKDGLTQLASLGITHIIVEKELDDNLTLVGQIGAYRIYEIRPNY